MATGFPEDCKHYQVISLWIVGTVILTVREVKDLYIKDFSSTQTPARN